MLKPLALILFLCTLVISTHCRIIQLNNNANLIEKTCKQTPNYALCIHYLETNPKSSRADVTGLALIMVDIIKSKANTAIHKINQLIRRTPPHDIMTALSTCAGQYKAIVVGDVPQAIAGLKQGDPKYAEKGAYDAANEALSCEKSFNNKSPITDDNNAMHEVALITAAIVKLLL